MQSQQQEIKMSESGQSKLFKEHICRNVCKLCNTVVQNEFCRLLFTSNEKKFTEFLFYILVLEKLADDRLFMLRSFSAFSAIVCRDICKHRTESCLPTKNQIVCYEAFLNQNNEKLDAESRAHIYETYSGINPGLIGIDYDLSDLPELQRRLRPKDRKSIRRRIKSAIKKVKKGMPFSKDEEKATDTAVKREIIVYSSSKKVDEKDKKITTTCFFNDNEEWKKELEMILDL